MASNLNSTLGSAEVMTRYLLHEEMFKENPKLIILEDHQWHLRSLDHNYVGVDMSAKTLMLCIDWF